MEGVIEVAASLTDAPLLSLAADLDELRRAGVCGIHVDIEDGRFVPELRLGLRVLDEVARWGGLPVDVHLMVQSPRDLLAQLPRSGLRTVFVHIEATHYPIAMLDEVRRMGYRAGLALNPTSECPELTQFAPFLDDVLLLSTEPSSGSPRFIDAVHGKVSLLAPRVQEAGLRLWVDGGVDGRHAERLSGSGASGLVVGRALIGPGVAEAFMRDLGRHSLAS